MVATVITACGFVTQNFHSAVDAVISVATAITACGFVTYLHWA